MRRTLVYGTATALITTARGHDSTVYRVALDLFILLLIAFGVRDAAF